MSAGLHYFLLLVAWWGGDFGFAETSFTPLSATDVLRSVKEHHPELASYRDDQDRAEGELTTTLGAFDLGLKLKTTNSMEGKYPYRMFDAQIEQATPLYGLRLFTGYRFGGGAFPLYDQNLETGTNGEGRAGVLVPLLRNGWTDSARTKIAQGRFKFDQAKQKFSQAGLKISVTGIKAYWKWVSAGQKKRIAENLLSIAETRDAALVKREQAGDLPKMDLVDNQRAILKRKEGLIKARLDLERAAYLLSLYIRDKDGRTKVPEDSALPPAFPSLESFDSPVQAALQKAKELRPELAIFELEYASVESERQLQSNQILPKLDLELSTAKDFGETPSVSTKQEYKVAVQLEFPLQNRAATGRETSAIAQESRIDRLKRWALEQIEAEIRATHAAVDAAILRVKNIEQEVSVTEMLEKGERTRFQNGDSNLFLINLREEATADARSRRVEALSDYFVSLAEFKVAQGFLPE